MTETSEGDATTFPLANLIDEIVEERNLLESFDYIVDHLEHAQQRERYRPQREAMTKKLAEEIESGTFRIKRGELRDMHIKEGAKERDVQAPPIEKRVGIHAIMLVVEKYVYRTLIHNTAASIKGRGIHWLHHIVEDDLRAAGEKARYYYQCDIRKYYDNIDQATMKAKIRQYVSDERLLPILDNFIDVMPAGLSKGLRSSQCFSNLYLNEVDHKMQERAERYGERGEGPRFLYYRYCDDVVMLAGDKRKLWKLRDAYVAEVTKLGLEVKSNEAVRPISSGLDFLGYVHYGTHTLLRKRIKQKAARKLASIKSRRRRQEVVGSLKGMACHADCKHMFHKLTKRTMKKFGELGIHYIPADGKKRFDGKVLSLGSLVNKEVEVHDFETGITTSQGDERYVVRVYDKQTGEWGKFFTASEEMKNILEQVREADGFPFETVIGREVFDGNKVRYKFT